MSDETVELRISNLEEARREQTAINAKLLESLHRIEMAIGSVADKSCPKPGLCLELQTLWKSKWESDRERFIQIENRLIANDEWHKEIESTMDAKLDKMKQAHEKTQTIVTRATGGIALLVVLMPWLVAFAKAYFSHP